jgi:hypothetical protein
LLLSFLFYQGVATIDTLLEDSAWLRLPNELVASEVALDVVPVLRRVHGSLDVLFGAAANPEFVQKLAKDMLARTGVMFSRGYTEHAFHTLIESQLGHMLAVEGLPATIQSERVFSPAGEPPSPPTEVIGRKGDVCADITLVNSSAGVANVFELKWARPVGSSLARGQVDSDSVVVEASLTQQQRQRLVTRLKSEQEKGSKKKKKKEPKEKAADKQALLELSNAPQVRVKLITLAEIAADQARECAKRLLHADPQVDIVHAYGVAGAGAHASVSSVTLRRHESGVSAGAP